MKKIMFKINKSKLCLGLFLGFIFGLMGVGYVNAATFAERLSQVGLDITLFINKNSISRYEVARLLNAANCRDCVQAPDWMKETYTQDFWDNFTSIDGKDFDDVGYEAAVWNKKSYYYCVAYVGENGYMVGYPSTSTKCKGSFCGQDAITTSEFYQTVLNIIQDQIRQKYLIDRSKVKSWKKGLKKNSIQMKVLNQTNIDVIDNADSSIRAAQSNDEFQTWLKYCMYNLSACDFQPFGVVGTGYWPVSELNVLYKEGIISLEAAQNIVSSPNIKGDEAIRIFSAVYDNYANCSFNVDYDCDGITNGDDNCPYMYNPNQYDLDGDGFGNVCDDDADGDGRKNPVGIVDDTNNVVASLRKKDLDQTPLGNRDLGFSLFVNVGAMSNGFPTTVRFQPLTNGNIDKIEWNFGDGNRVVVNNGDSVTHIFNKSGGFTVKAIAISKNGAKSSAMTKIFIAEPKSEKYLLNIKPSIVFKDGTVEYTFAPLYSGDFDTISWDINNQGKKALKLTESFKAKIKEDGKYVVTAKGYKNGELKAMAMLTMLQDGTPAFSSININPGDLWEETLISSNLVGILQDDIDSIDIDWGGMYIKSNDLINGYTYDEAGLKTIQHNVVLKNGITLQNIVTITVKNPLLAQSYALNISGNRLGYNQNENLNLWLNMYPKAPVMSLFTSYQVGQKRFLYNPDFSKLILDFDYSDAGDKLLTNSVEVNRCVSLLNQGTVHINSIDTCEGAIKNGAIGKYKCDLDGDNIPDICDDDIDGDGIKNLIGIILYENKDCSIGKDNLDADLLKKQFGVCSLDNCPFDVNSDQYDLNNNGMGDVCESIIPNLLSGLPSNVDNDYVVILDGDQDGDGVPDSVDACVNVPGNSSDGCPIYTNQDCRVFSACGNGKIDEGENCRNCPEDVGVCCGNGTLDSGEDCKTCPVDAGKCDLCGNGKIDEGENCRNCPNDVGKCTAFCGDGKIQEAEDCKNCEKDVGKCVATCGDGKIQVAEDCKNCSKDVGKCRDVTCGDGNLDEDAGEQCDNGESNGKDGKCTNMCTIYDVNKPNCGNGKIDEGEDCKTCPVDLGEKCVANGEKWEGCGNGEIEKGENCKNCPEDVGECTAFCGNKKIERAEDCRNCPEDVGECTATCGNGKIEEGEDCKNCEKDVLKCKDVTCGDGNLDEDAGEQCDSGKDNNKKDDVKDDRKNDEKNGKCTNMCAIYDENKPNCGNGKIEEGEDCKTCPVDLGEKCVDFGINEDFCGNGEINEGENCKNCPEDIGKCVAYCGDGKIDDAEDCRNCEKDVGKCVATCGNGKIDEGENCKNCSKDVKICIDVTCGNGKIDKESGEECDNGEDNGKDGKCTRMCTEYKEDKPNCGNGILDKGENCQTCPIDLGEKCVLNGDKGIMCGNGDVDEGEQCDPKDENQENWGSIGCSNSCQQKNKDSIECNSNYDGMILSNLLNSYMLCNKGLMKNFSFNINKLQWSWICEDKDISIKCFAKKSVCGDGFIGDDEKCENCSLDLKDLCVVQVEDNCKCDECPEKLKDICIDDGTYEEDCKCDECPGKLKDLCLKPDEPEEPENPYNPNKPDVDEDSWYVENDNCNSCPCEYVDFSTDLNKKDRVRAKLWDKGRSAFYRYSNTVVVGGFLDE